MLGTWFGAEHVWALAGSDEGQGCVAFGLWANGRYVAFAAPMESDVERLNASDPHAPYLPVTNRTMLAA